MSDPAIFHVTHWKAGSQWVRAVLTAAAPGRVVSPDHDPEWFFKTPKVPGRVYTPVYETRQSFRRAVAEDADQRTFLLIRDPRDTAVSWYFSHRYSHGLEDASVGETRAILGRLDKTEGLALIISNHLRDAIDIQTSWIETGVRVFKYEDLRADQQGEFGKLLEFCRIDLPEKRRRAIIARNSFERKTWWRFGRENVKSHLRKGVSGDWKNHFCPRLKKLFKDLYGEVLIRSGYEGGSGW
jgi:lipopolysaccharide transport system ATP-binding protein